MLGFGKRDSDLADTEFQPLLRFPPGKEGGGGGAGLCSKQPMSLNSLEPGLCHQEPPGLNGHMALPWREDRLVGGGEKCAPGIDFRGEV